MRIPSHTPTPVVITVGDLIGELCRWPDHAAVKFRCALQHQELQFDRIESRSKGAIEIELEPAPKSAPVAPA
jgi:hypothetical protein